MRELADADRIRCLMQALGEAAPREGDCYLTGGATAVLLDWRATTLAVSLKPEPEQDEVLRALPRMKGELAVNVELASPADFIRSRGSGADGASSGRAGRLTFRHFDLYSQALAKLERGHAQDVEEVREMLARGLVEKGILRSCFVEIEPKLYRFPAVDPDDFRRSVEEFAGSS